MQDRPRKFRGYAALERPAGALIWGSLRPSREEAALIYAKWNPGRDQPPHIVAVTMEIDNAS